MTDRSIVSPPAASAIPSSFADDVRYYLSLEPRQLPSKYLYDPLGSALFDAITHLPWYPLARAEKRLLDTHGAAIFGIAAGIDSILELGPGDGEKLSILLRGAPATLRVPALYLVDVSEAALSRATSLLSATGARPRAYQHTYEEGLARFARERGPRSRTLVLLLGSNIGNFDTPGAAAFVRTIRASLQPGDALLLGTDLVKPERDLLLAYDDPLGITAAFNLNLLVRMNRELDADFVISQFAHRAVWNRDVARVEMHLVSRENQTVRVRAADLALTFGAGESIWTESSYKYRPEDVAALLAAHGFAADGQWIDAADAFALTLATAR